MIKFFRRIRQNLLMENKTGKYFKYAVGEIVLVVIGILIALQINNWNENRKNSHQEHKILLALKSDFTESKIRLKATMIQQKNVLARCIALISIHESKIPMPINDSIKIYIEDGALSWYRAELVTSSYDALINTGNTDIIKNEYLNKSLAEFFSILNAGYEDHETCMYVLNRLISITETIALPLSDSSIRKRRGLYPNSDSNKEDEAIKYLFKQEALFGNLYSKVQLEGNRYQLQENLLKRVEDILLIIDEELKLVKND
jgi:hypothetical protein